MKRKKNPYLSTARSTERYTGPGKQATREHNLALVRTAPGLWDKENRLRCDWAELCGNSIMYTVTMLEKAEILRPGGFVGIDTDRKRIERFKVARPDLKWVAGDLRNQITWLLKNCEVGVLNFDGYLEVGMDHTRTFFSTIRPLVRQGIKLFGSFVLFSNNCLDSVVRHPEAVHGGQRSTALRMHTQGVVEELHGYFPRRSLRFDDLLPKDFEKKADDGCYEGPLGGYRIYAGTNQNLRMIELGVVL